tara:strand:+ start:4859 stop:5731 length:873 start_codon:yes stop_codon:yes gene_type:complete
VTEDLEMASMSGMTSNFATCAGYEIHYTQWGSETAEPVVMWHGLTHNGRFFDPLARALSDRYRIICPDTIGRGLSQWPENPESEYCFEVYSAIAQDLMDRLGLDTIRWVGSSMGGSLGMILAGGAMKDRISHLVLDDIGPEIPAATIQAVSKTREETPFFPTVQELADYFRVIYSQLSNIEFSDAEWLSIARRFGRRADDGRFTIHNDPRVITQMTDHPEDFDLWAYYDAITAKTFLLRGGRSIILAAETAAEMERRGPRPRIHLFEDIGHAPWLTTPGEIDLIADFLAT